MKSRQRSKLAAATRFAWSATCPTFGSVHRAAEQIIALGLPIAGLLNNAGIFPITVLQTAEGWDATFATDHLGPFAFTEALIPRFPDGANIVFIVSAVEDPQRKPAVMAGFRAPLGSRPRPARAANGNQADSSKPP